MHVCVCVGRMERASARVSCPVLGRSVDNPPDGCLLHTRTKSTYQDSWNIDPEAKKVFLDASFKHAIATRCCSIGAYMHAGMYMHA